VNSPVPGSFVLLLLLLLVLVLGFRFLLEEFEDEDDKEDEEDGVFTQTLNAALLRLPLRCAVETAF